MLIQLHKQATTTPKVRAAIQGSDDAGTVLAERFGVTPQTVYKWRRRASVEDRGSKPRAPCVADDVDADTGGCRRGAALDAAGLARRSSGLRP
jgi:transposase-like protein